MRSVYLDHQSATPLLPEAWEAMQPFFKEAYGNPVSLHRYGLQVREAVDKARSQFAALINAESAEEILFTSDATESANLAIKGFAHANRRKGKHIVLSATEHPSVLQSAMALESEGFTYTLVPVDKYGILAPEAVREAITPETILVAIQIVNHDIGAIQPIKEISKITQEKNIPLYCDAAAAAGWYPLDVQAMGVQMLSLSADRFYGPKGCGILYRNKKARVTSHIHGGIQETGRRAGVQNIPAIVGGGVAAEMALRELTSRITHVSALQKRLWDGLSANVKYIILNGPPVGPQRVCYNINLSTEFIEGEGQLLLCDINGIALASGSSCVSKDLKISHVLAAIGLDHALAQGNLIITLGKDNTQEDVDYVVETFPKIVEKLRGMSPMWQEFQEGKLDSVIAPTGRGKSFAQHAAEVSGKPQHG